MTVAVAAGTRPFKSAIARLLSSAPVGRAVGLLTRDRVPSRGIVFDTRLAAFSPSIKAAMLFGIYESAEIRFIRSYISPDVDVVELGSSLGVTSAHILGVLGPGHTLTCVEANPHVVGALQATVRAAEERTGRRARIVHGSVTARPANERAALALADSSLGTRVVEDGSGSGETVPTVALDSLVSNLDSFSLVIDIEGGEAGLIAEAGQTLRQAQEIVIELHPTTYRGRPVSVSELTSSLLDDLGFRLLDRNGPVLALGR
jgi:FkbM family methyltransferase